MISLPRLRFSLSARRAFFISSSKLVVYSWFKDDLGPSYIFDANEEGLDFFRRYLKETPNDLVYILLDMAEEEYRIDTIPHVFGDDRNAVLHRKRQRVFRGTPYFYADIQGRQESGRRDDNVMLSAITDPEAIVFWLEALKEHKVPLAAMVSLPLLVQEIEAIIPDMHYNALVFSLQSISGLRQSFFVGRKLKFSRLVKIPRYGSEPYAPIIIDELVRIRRYINNAHLIDENKPVDFYFFGDQALFGELNNMNIASLMIRYHPLDVSVLGQAHGMREHLETPFSDQYFVYQLLKHKSKNYYAGAPDRQYFRMRQISKSVRLANFLLVLCSVIWASSNIFEGFTYRQQQRVETQKVNFYSERYNVAKARIPVLEFSPDDLKVIVNASDTLKRYKATPVAMFNSIGSGLNNFPAIEIRKIKWFVNMSPHHKLSVKPAGADYQKSLDTNVGGGIDEDYIYYQIALIDGYLKEFDGDYREAFKLIDQFVESLSRQKHIHSAKVVELPLDITSVSNLQGSSKESSKKSDFSVRVILGIQDEA